MTVMSVMEALGDRGMDQLYTIQASASVAEAVEEMGRPDIGASVVSTADRLPAGTPLSLVMTRDVHFVTPGTTLEAALALMYVHRHRHLVVMDGPHLHGIVSMRDLAYQLIRHGEGRFEAAVRLAGGPGT